ncbi:lycopene beta-cyclase CrtY [Novosphingobium tardum]|uniref:Lycopene beta-cyclase CrtY n=1 Tax=Novosphingobium tardum TaxID=1538021 RepID=A0ABV8RR84_9SPHN
MIQHHTDLAILGGGLSGGLIALALASARPGLRVMLIEQGESLGGNHIWSFFDSDIAPADRALVAPLVERHWDGYDVRFPGSARTLGTGYNSITSARFDAVLRAALPGDAVLTGAVVAAADPAGVTLADGRRIAARGVIDARGLTADDPSLAALDCAWQKFHGQMIECPAPHGLTRPRVMDARVTQHDGFRFVYCLPFDEHRVFVEDTYYSDGPAIDPQLLAGRIAAYAEAQGWSDARVLASETGVLPVVIGGDFDAFWPADDPLPRAGTRAGLFHPLTSFSLPDAVRLASLVAGLPAHDSATLAVAIRDHARNRWNAGGYYRLLTRMMFRAAEPAQRWRPLAHFYRIGAARVERFYAGRSTMTDKLRILMGRPPVPLGRALATIAGTR